MLKTIKNLTYLKTLIQNIFIWKIKIILIDFLDFLDFLSFFYILFLIKNLIL